MISRYQLDYAESRLFQGKALIIYGARQVGKTTFCNQLLSRIDRKTLRLNGDDTDTRELLSRPNATEIKRIIGSNEVVLLDEAQRISEAGLVLKIIVDQIPSVQVIATGSSSFELAGSINEPLTGRKYVLYLSPLSYQELVAHTDFLAENRLLRHRLIFGSYPEVITKPDRAEEHLKLLADSYLYRDLFTLDKIKKPMLFEKIVKGLALQVGSEVRISELAQLVGADNKTVEKYIDLLQKAFVIFPLPAFSRNVRNEIKKGRKIYFYDNGIINAITGNFNPVESRSGVGALWENYIVSERRKYLAQHQLDPACYFWRTTQQQEIDYIEDAGSDLLAVEFKWNTKSKASFPITFRKAYPKVKTEVITPENRHEFLTGS